VDVEEQIEHVVIWEDCVNVGIEIVGYETEANWLLGCLANRICRLDFHDPNLTSQTATLKAFAGEIKQHYETVKDAYRVVSRIDRPLRDEYPMLSYGHWREITRRGKAKDKKALRAWAIRSTDHGWSVSQLREQLRGNRNVKSADPVKLMRKVVGVVGDLAVLDMEACWKNEADEINDVLLALEAAVDRIDTTRRKMMDG